MEVPEYIKYYLHNAKYGLILNDKSLLVFALYMYVSNLVH